MRRLLLTPCLRTLVHLRLQAAVPTFLSRLRLNVNACPHLRILALVQFGQSSATQSAFHATRRHDDVDHLRERSVMGSSASAHPHSLLDTCHVNSQVCMHHCKCSHIHTSASEGTSLNAAPASESALHPPTPAQSTRRKGLKNSQSAAAALELLDQKVSLLGLEQVSLCDATILSKSRSFKSTSFECLAAVLKVLKDLLGSGEKACRALVMNPGILLHPSELLEQKLKVLADFGIREEVVRKLCTTRSVLTRKVESLHKSLSLLEEIGLTVEARNRVLRSRPVIIRTSDTSILHNLDFFKSSGMSRKEILCSLRMHPALLSYSVDNLRKKYDLFQRLGLTVSEFTCAGLPLLTIEKFQAQIKFFKDQGFSDSDVRVLISRYPVILKLTDKVLKSKLDFLLCEQNYDVADIVKCPICLAFSLQGRLIARLKALKEKGLSKVYTLSTILACNDLKFQELGRRGK